MKKLTITCLGMIAVGAAVAETGVTEESRLAPDKIKGLLRLLGGREIVTNGLLRSLAMILQVLRDFFI